MSEPAEELFQFRKAVINTWEPTAASVIFSHNYLNGNHLVSVASLFMKASMQSNELKHGQCNIQGNS
jgi:hypothetical protein